MKSAKRSFGWVQNPSNFKTLKRVISIFDKESMYFKDLVNRRLPLIKLNGKITEKDYNAICKALDNEQISYEILKGRGSNSGSRSEALCSGIVQAVVDGQRLVEYAGFDGERVIAKKLYCDDWTADGFLRWAISIGFLEYSYKDDTCCITPSGKEFVESEEDSAQENRIMMDALMSYPPVMRVMSLLESGQHLTKFEIGSQLGFKGELGFTSIPQDYFIALYNEAETSKERSQIKQNVEGDSDKYARMICSWLKKLKCVASTNEIRTGEFNGEQYGMSLACYHITARGLKELKRARGNSSNPRITKIVMYEMLATKAPNAGFLRYRRAILINALTTPKTIDDIAEYCSSMGIELLPQTICDDIENLRRIGLEINVDSENRYMLKDKVVGLTIPEVSEKKEDITDIKEQVRSRLNNLSHEYLILIDLAFSDCTNKSRKNLDARNFEIQTANLLTKEISFDGLWLGGADRPDIAVWSKETGVIVDNKAYKGGFAVGRGNEDEMVRYINQAQKMQEGFPANNWWKCFSDNKVSELRYLFVTSFLKGSYLKNLQSIYQRTEVSGGAIAVVDLLYFVEGVKRGLHSESDLLGAMKNDELKFDLVNED